MPIQMQLTWLFVLALPVACIAWTVTHEEIFSEPRAYCTNRCKTGKSIIVRKFFYLFTCEYCFSHYVALFFIFFTGYRLLLDDWRGYIISGFSLVWIANIYMTLFGVIRQDAKKEKMEINAMEKKLY